MPDIEGRWTSEIGEDGCKPHWGAIYDDGCVAPGLHVRKTFPVSLYYLIHRFIALVCQIERHCIGR